LRQSLPDLHFRSIIDVGANVGQSVERYLVEFPGSVVHCFEPVPSTFDQLFEKFVGNPRVHLHKLALGSKPGAAMMRPDGGSSTFRVSSDGYVPVEIGTLDEFCASQGIQHVNFLKVDTEGFDLEVLMGAVELIARSAIDVVQVEVGMSPRHHVHVRFEDVKAFMESKGMELFSIIDQMRNFVPGGPYLQWADAVFISRAVTARYRSARHIVAT
jgi:FkbM family methyltransferase